MKKIVAIFFFLILIPTLSLAKTTRGEVVGWWSLYTDESFCSIYLGSDGTAIYFETSGISSRNVNVDCRSGEWAIIDNNTVVLSLTDNIVLKATYMNEKLYYHVPDLMGMIGMNREQCLTLANMDVELIP